MPPEEPKTLQEFLWRIRHYEAVIYVRQGSETLSLDEVSPKDWAYWVAKWIEEGFNPHRIRTVEEMEEEQR